MGGGSKWSGLGDGFGQQTPLLGRAARAYGALALAMGSYYMMLHMHTDDTVSLQRAQCAELLKNSIDVDY